MNADERRFFDSLTERVPGAIFEVANTLGAGFLEKVYERALLKELSLLGIQAVSQASFPVSYKGEYVGEYYADILVENVLVVELKCVERLATQPSAQCLNSLARIGHESLSAGQLSEANRRMEASRPSFPFLGSALPVFVGSRSELTVDCSGYLLGAATAEAAEAQIVWICFSETLYLGRCLIPA